VTDRPPDDPTLIQAGAKLGGQVVTSLGGQFLALLLVNIIFLGVVFWFLDARAKYTVALINQLLAACLTKQ